MKKKNHIQPSTPVKSGGLRVLLISGMTREQQIAFIKRKDNFYSGASFAGHSDQQVRQIALSLDKKVQGKNRY